MSSTDSDIAGSADQRLEQIIAAYVTAAEFGESPDREALLAEHPDVAHELRQFFAHRDRMENLLDPLRSAAARVLNVRCPHCRHVIELVDEAKVSDISCPTCGSSFSLLESGSTCRFPGGLKRIGQFQLLEQVGVGQFGSVWKARDLTLERFVAVKIPRGLHLSKTEAELFIRDARLAAKLTHPNIVPVHEVGRQDDTFYIVSEFIQGATLKEWISTKRLTPTETAQLCVSICRALQHAHENGVIHRDLKPSNVMLDVRRNPHIVDFGLAKRDTDEITMTLDGQILGTPAYMPPEQARGEGHHVDCRADVYSMGVILFELLTGELPFRGDKQMLIVQILNDPPPSLARLDDSVPRDLEVICLKCLRKDAANRYSSAGALADDLQRWLDGDPIHARPVSRWELAYVWCRKHPAVSSLLALLAVVLIGAGLVAWEIQQRERAHGLVNQLLASDLLESDSVVRQLVPYKHRVQDQLRTAAVAASMRHRHERELVVRVAACRLYQRRSDIDWIGRHLLSARPEHFPVLCELLRDAEPGIVPRLWEVAADQEGSPARRIRAAAALAAFDAENDRWSDIAPIVVHDLTTTPAGELTVWRDQFHAVSGVLSDLLTSVLQDEEEWIQKRIAAAGCVAAWSSGSETQLFELLMTCNEYQFMELVPVTAKYPDAFVSLLEQELKRPAPEWSERDRMRLYRRRRAVAAIALWLLDRADLAASVLRRSPEPGARTRFIHWAARAGVTPRALINQVKHGSDDGVRAAAVLALGEFNPSQISARQRNALVPVLLEMFRSEPDRGLHGAVEWLLREWGFAMQVDEVIVELQANPVGAGDGLRQWAVTSESHTMVTIDADEFLMGIPFDIAAKASSPEPQRTLIGRDYSISSNEITRRQFFRFLKERGHQEDRHAANEYSATPDQPQNFVSWYDAVEYCNWLSKREGIPRDQWCYEPNSDGLYAEGMRVAPDFLARTGYRLPTDAELEFACRGGTTTLRPIGDDTTFLPKYAWYSQRSTQSVGLLKPNDFGLFDILGNICEWYGDPNGASSRAGEPFYVDSHVGAVVLNEKNRGARGGGFAADSQRTDSSDRGLSYAPTHASWSNGFRVARTVRPSVDDLLVRARESGRLGHWRQAAATMQSLIEHADGNERAWFELAWVWQFLEEEQAAKSLCGELLERYGRTSDPSLAHLAVQTLLSRPDCVVTGDIERLAKISTSRGGSLGSLHVRDLGMLRFRQGRFEEAEEALNRADESSYLRGKPKTWYFLAMTRHARGDTLGAQEAFRTAEAYRARLKAGFTRNDYGERWAGWLLIESIRREAESRLGTSE